MFTNSVLFQAGGISFTLAKCFAIAGILLGGVAALVFVLLFKHSHGTVKRMSPEEAARAQVYGVGQSWDFVPDPIVATKAVGAVGRSAEITTDIDSMRNAYRRGDWMTFWLWPILITCWGMAFWLVFMAAFVHWPDIPAFAPIMTTAVVGFFISIGWFMAWAAVYTNIDLGKAESGRDAPPAEVKKHQS